MYRPLLYTQDDLAVMWCRLNEGRHPLNDNWKFNPLNIPGAMAFINELVGPSKCLTTWRKRLYEPKTNEIERRRARRD